MSNARNLANLLNTDTTIATGDVADGSITSAKLDTNIAVSGTLGVTGAVTANAGVNIDNITIDGQEIDVSSGDLTLDVAGDIVFDADGGDVNFQDGGTLYGFLAKSNDNLLIGNAISDGDVLIRGNDGGSNITALSLDMSVGGMATIANGLVLSDGNIVFADGHGLDFGNTSGSATGSSSALLDDYEEGTFNCTTSQSGYAIQAQGGKYTKIGRFVHIQFTINFNLVGSSNATVTIAGLPFTNGSFQSTGVIRESTNSGAVYVVIVQASSSEFSFNAMDGVSNNSTRRIHNNENYAGSITYTI